LNIAVQTKDGSNIIIFSDLFSEFKNNYNIDLLLPKKKDLIKAGEFDWDDEKDFKNTTEDKQDIIERWDKVFGK
jgi:hypothetical protein